MHHNLEVWTNPEKFDPDRFLPEKSIERDVYSYIPFSVGSRNCIAQKFGLLEIKIALTILLRKYHVKSVLKPSEVKFVCFSTLKPYNENLEIYFMPRNI